MENSTQVKSFGHLFIFNIDVFKGITNILSRADIFYIHGTPFRDVEGEGAVYSGIVYIIWGIISLFFILNQSGSKFVFIFHPENGEFGILFMRYYFLILLISGNKRMILL